MLDPKLKRRAVHRAKILAGQISALAKGIERADYCIDLLLQSLSIQKSLRSLDKLMLENHLHTHVVHQMRNSKEAPRAIKELLKIYTYVD